MTNEMRELFVELSDGDLYEFVRDARDYATCNTTPNTIELGLLVAAHVAEAELSERETEWARVEAYIHAERDELARCQAEAARHEAAECHRLWQKRIAAGECPL